jgi:hypothetical protein
MVYWESGEADLDESYLETNAKKGKANKTTVKEPSLQENYDRSSPDPSSPEVCSTCTL